MRDGYLESDGFIFHSSPFRDAGGANSEAGVPILSFRFLLISISFLVICITAISTPKNLVLIILMNLFERHPGSDKRKNQNDLSAFASSCDYVADWS